MKIFRAYDIRGIYPTELNERIALKVGRAFGTFNPGKTVVGCDVRLSSPCLKKELIDGLLSAGSKVIDIGTVTTPMVMFSVRRLRCDGGVMVSASHNPKEFNGFKFYGENGAPIGYEDGLDEIEKIYNEEKFSKGEGKLTKKNILEDYFTFLKSNIQIKNPERLKVVIDAGNGSAGIFSPTIFRRFGIKVHELFCEPDGNFPNHLPDPSIPENLKELQRKVLETNSDFGLAYDGDGDRLAVVDENGKIVYVGVIFSILIKNILAESPGAKVIYTVADSKAIEDIIKNQGGIPVACRVGHTFISRKMVEEGAMLGGEISGHYYFKETFGADDALFASLKLIEFLSKSEKKISDYEKEFPKYYSEISEANRFPIKESEKFSFIENLKKEFREKYKIETLDGVKVIFKDGWALIRPSHTEAKICISYESKTKKGFDRIKRFVDKIISRIPR